MFEVQRRRQVPKVSEVSEESKIQTVAEQKMDKTLKKMQKTSKIPKWNPTDWQVSGKTRVRVKGRRWDDVSVPQWIKNCETDMRRWGVALKDPRESVRERSLPRKYDVYTGVDNQPTIVPQSGTIFLRKSKSVHEVFFSSIGNMHQTCADIPIKTEAPSSDQESIHEKITEKLLSNEEDENQNIVKPPSPLETKPILTVNIDENENILESDPLLQSDYVSSEVSLEPDSLNPNLGKVSDITDSENLSSLDLSLGSSIENESYKFSEDNGERQSIDNSEGGMINDSNLEDNLSLINYLSLEPEKEPPPRLEHESPPPISPTTSSNQQQEHFTQISKQSLSLFNDLDRWKIVHYSRAANWILERVRSETESHGDVWNCIVGESGSFQFSVTSSQVHEISFDHITVLLFKTNKD